MSRLTLIFLPSLFVGILQASAGVAADSKPPVTAIPAFPMLIPGPGAIPKSDCYNGFKPVTDPNKLPFSGSDSSIAIDAAYINGSHDLHNQENVAVRNQMLFNPR